MDEQMGCANTCQWFVRNRAVQATDSWASRAVVTIELRGPEAVAEFLETVASLVAKGHIVGLSITMSEGMPCRASVVFDQASTRDIVKLDAGDKNNS